VTVPLLFLDLSYEPCVVFDPGRMSLEYPAGATGIGGDGIYHTSKNVAAFGAPVAMFDQSCSATANRGVRFAF
jgi:hypothetical protein